MAQQFEIDDLAKRIYKSSRYSIKFSAGKAIARYELLTKYADWSGDYTEKVFDSEARAIEFLKDKSMDHADRVLEAEAIEDEAYE
jgi:hypothetical protein